MSRPPFAGDARAFLPGPCEAEREPGLRMAVRENAGDVRVDADEFLADSVRAINAPEQLIEFIASHRVLKFCQRLPVWWIGEGIAEVVGGASGGAAEDKEEAEEDPKRRRAKDHGLDFRLFNTMLARC